MSSLDDLTNAIGYLNREVKATALSLSIPQQDFDVLLKEQGKPVFFCSEWFNGKMIEGFLLPTVYGYVKIFPLIWEIKSMPTYYIKNTKE